MVPAPATSSALRCAYALASAGAAAGSFVGISGDSPLGVSSVVVTTAVVGQILVGLLVIPD